MIFFKHRLRKKLPYYRLTRNAKRRMDEIAETLPPRETGVVDLTPPAEQEVNGPRHLKQEVPQPIQPVRERPAAVFMRVAVSALVCIAFVGLIATVLILRSAAPATLPAAASSELTPTAAPTPAPLYTMKIENAEIRGGCAFFDVVLTFLEEEYRHAAFYTTELNSNGSPDSIHHALLIGGKKNVLDGSPIFYQEDLPSRYRATVSAKLPESYESGSIDAEFTISALYGMNFGGDSYAPMIEPDVAIEESVAQSFTLTEATPWATVVGAANGVDLEFVQYDWTTGLFNVRIRYPDLDGFLPSLSIIDGGEDGKMLSPYFIDDKFSNGDGTAYITFVYKGLTESTERLLLRVWFPYFNENLEPMDVLAAEYSLFPQEDWFMRSGEYQELGMREFDMELITANWQRPAVFYADHVYMSYGSFRYVEMSDGTVSPTVHIFLDTDLPWALPLQCEFKTTDGEEILLLLYGEPNPEGEQTPGNAYYSVENYLRNGKPHRAYVITATFEKEVDFSNNHPLINIRNIVSGRNLGNTTAWYSDPNGEYNELWGMGHGHEWWEQLAKTNDPSADPQPEPSPEPPAASQPPADQMPEDGQLSELPPDDSQSSENKEPEQSAPPEGESTPAPDDET